MLKSKKFAQIRDKLAEAKFFFDTGMSFLVFFNFSLLVIAASSKLQEAWEVSTLTIWLTLVPVALIGTWIFGLLLDKFVKYQTSYYKAANDRVPQVVETLELARKINQRLDNLEKEIYGRKRI